jgi:carboxylesterase type B
VTLHESYSRAPTMVEADQILERILDSNTSFEFGGVRDHRFGGNLLHFRGIPYATIPERFAKPILATSWREHGPSFTEYGALCPQPAFPVESSMCIPPNHGEQNGSEGADIKFDEFTCCNLNVTCPEIRGATASASRSRSKWPVYVWIHGGGQSVSFPSAQNRLGDPGPLVAQSIEMNKPIILVTVNYRLNIFGFGDPDGVNVNLGMQDQATAVRWVQDYIYLFGGDPVGLTLSVLPKWKPLLLAAKLVCRKTSPSVVNRREPSIPMACSP